LAAAEPDLTRLGAALAQQLGDPGLVVTATEPLTAGASRLTWLIGVEWGDGTAERLVLQRERVRGARPGGIVTEAALLRVMAAAGVPVPHLLLADETGEAIDGGFLLVREVEGETIGPRIRRREDLAGARAGFAADAGRILAAVHTCDPAGLPLLPAADPLASVEAMLDSAHDARPALEAALAWLRRNQPPPRPPRLVHGDFRLGNLMIGPDGIRAVLDWELAHLGDPLEDLGWLASPAWRFGGALPVAGVASREQLWSAYEAAGGQPVDPAAARWWELYATLRWGAMCLMQARTHLSGESRSVELAVLGRRAAECEYDLVTELFGGVQLSDPPAVVPPDLYGRPTATELIESVCELLEARGAAGDFALRVAAGSLRVVERELAAGAPAEAEHRQRLRELGIADDGELAYGLRSGAIPLDEPVTSAIAADVTARLAVYNPRYMTV
jgi:aminoglycoside phosphotransferase (APT) family kinase protein